MSALLLRARGVCFAHGPIPLISGLDLELVRGSRLGVIGENGAGKTTLLRLLDGTLAPDEGSLTRGDGVHVVHCPQDVEEPDARVRALVADTSTLALRWCARLRVDVQAIDRWPTMSPGERRRFQLAAALVAQPDVLLLDEPTNHLDGEARTLLVGALHGLDGALVVVSHDRALLDELCPRTLRLHRGGAELFELSASRALAQVRHDEERKEHERGLARMEARKAARILGDARRDAASADAQRSAGRRMKNADDHDARGVGAQALADWASARLSRHVAVARKRADDARGRAEALASDDKVLGRAVHVESAALARPRLCVVRGTLVVTRGARIHIDGDNGAGKSTLLREIEVAAGTVPGMLVLPQDLSSEDERRALDDMRALPPDERGHALQLLAALGVDPARVLSSAHPSAGEARKLLLARALAGRAPAVLLDEPTNHLDLPSIERLEAALAAYGGALVVVTHDHTFARGARLQERWRVAGGASFGRGDEAGRFVERGSVSVEPVRGSS